MAGGLVPDSVPVDAKVLQGIVNYMTNHAIKKEDWTDDITEITQGDSEFFGLSHMGGTKMKPTINRKYNYSFWYDEIPDILMPDTLVAGTGTISIPKTVINVGGLYRDVVFGYEDINSLSGVPVRYRVVGNPVEAGDSMTYSVVRLEEDPLSESGFRENPSVPAAAIRADIAGKLCNVLFTAKPAGGDDNNPIFSEVETGFNYVQTHQHHTKIDDYTAAEAWRHNISPEDWQIGKMMIYHARDIENSFWFGVPLHDVKRRVGEDRTMTRGFFNHKDVQNLTALRNTFTYRDFIVFCERYVTLYGSQKNFVGFCNPAFKTFIVDMMDTPGAKAYFTYDAYGKTNSYGVDVHKLITPHCTVELRDNYSLRNYLKHVPILVIVDIDKCRSRTLVGHGHALGTKLGMGTQVPDANYFLNKVRRTYGLEMQAEKCHSWLKLVG